MLGNVKVRTKLIAILAAPVLALVAVAAVGVTDRAGVARETRTVGELTRLAARSTAVVRELGRESVLSAAVLASSGATGVVDLEDQRDRTDQAVDELRLARREIDTDGLDEAVRTAIDDGLDQLGLVRPHRASVDNRIATFDGSVRVYAQLADQLLGATAVSAAETGEAELAAQVTAYAAATRAGDLLAQEEATATAVGLRDRIEVDEQERIRAIVEAQATQLAVFAVGATPDQKVRLRGALAEPASMTVERMRSELLRADPGTPLGFDVEDWTEAATAKTALLRQVDESVAGRIVAMSDALRADAERDQWAYLALAGGAALVALVLALLVGRATVRPLRRLTEAAYAVSQRQLPRLIEGLRNPSGDVVAPDLTPIEVTSTDEVGQLAEAFNSIQTVAVDVAAEQAALLRKGIGDMFVNLARRNQSLLDRQITFLDQLEANERDPDLLAHLFKLDHLATRMRRNAESLLVLAGVEPARRWGEPLPLGDVVRAAISEVEDYARVNVLALDDARVAGRAVVDVAHLLAELLDNAIAYSPPDTSVDVVGRRTDRGYVLSLTDLGIGMTEVQLAGANRILSHPPVMGLSLARSLGLVVVGRLAERHGIGVRLTQTPLGGVTATVTLPVDVLAVGTGDHEVPAVARDEIGARPAFAEGAAPTGPVPVPGASLPVRARDRGPVDPRHPAAVGDAARRDELAAQLPPSLAHAVPEGFDFDAGLAALTADATAPDPTVAAPVAAAPVEPPVTAAGLTRRTPKRAAPVEAPGEEVADTAEAVRASHRSPEEIQSMLSRYRSGRERGRGGAADVREDEE